MTERIITTPVVGWNFDKKLPVHCQICKKDYKNNKSFGVHKSRYHRGVVFSMNHVELKKVKRTLDESETSEKEDDEDDDGDGGDKSTKDDEDKDDIDEVEVISTKKAKVSTSPKLATSAATETTPAYFSALLSEALESSTLSRAPVSSFRPIFVQENPSEKTTTTTTTTTSATFTAPTETASHQSSQSSSTTQAAETRLTDLEIKECAASFAQKYKQHFIDIELASFHLYLAKHESLKVSNSIAPWDEQRMVKLKQVIEKLGAQKHEYFTKFDAFRQSACALVSQNDSVVTNYYAQIGKSALEKMK